MRCLLLILLLMPMGLADVCVSFQDCPVPSCMGSVRLCEGNMCVATPCAVPSAEELKPEVETFEEAVKPYERGINLSVKTKNPSGIKNNILGALGLQGVLFLLLKGIALLFVAIILAMFLMLAKSKGLSKIIVVSLLVVCIILAVAFIFGGKDTLFGLFSKEMTWSEASARHFLPGGFLKRQMATQQLSYLSPRLIDGSEFRGKEGSHEINVIVLEIDDKQFLGAINMKKDGETKYISGEEALYNGKARLGTITFDEDRFVFIVSGYKKGAESVAESIISRYPTKPTKSRLFSSDMVPPVIEFISPEKGALTNERTIVLSISDNISGVNPESITVRGLEGFSLGSCIRKGYAYECAFRATGLLEGENQLEVEAFDWEGNKNRMQNTFIFDSAYVRLDSFSPPHGSYSNKETLDINLSDKTSGIGSVEVLGIPFEEDDCAIDRKQVSCSIRHASPDGKVSVQVLVADSAGNSYSYDHMFYYDATAPDGLVRDNYFEAEDNMGIESVSVNDKAFSLSSCAREGKRYFCRTEEAIDYVLIRDKAGNIKNLIN